MKVKKSCGRRAFALLLAALLLFPLSAAPIGAASARESGARPPIYKGKLDIASVQLIPGGMPFGIRVEMDGVMVVGLSEIKCGGKTCRPAHEAGVRKGDILLSVNGKDVKNAEEASAAIAAAGEKPLALCLRRGEEQKNITLTPKKSDADGQYRCGLWLRDSASGIGTVTFIEPKSGAFGGLGHGVCDGDTGALVALGRGSVLSVQLGEAVKGECGKPGELRGSFTGKRLGRLLSNSPTGVFGILSDPASLSGGKYGALPVAAAKDVKEGAATVLCTTDSGTPQEYAVEIFAIDHSARPTKSFSVRVTDPALLEKTGGIVQGMSGSPIIQNGKLVGAVTHVLVDDPTTGYGIFIENMLTSALPQKQGKAA